MGMYGETRNRRTNDEKSVQVVPCGRMVNHGLGVFGPVALDSGQDFLDETNFY